MRIGAAFLAMLSALLWGGVLLRPASATVEMAQQTKKACKFCHTKAGSKDDLNDAGNYYKENKTLTGYKPKQEKK